MIANFFRKTKPIHAIFISVLFFCYYLANLIFIEKPSISILYLSKTLGKLVLFLILFFLIRFINRKNQLSSQNSYVLLVLALLFGIFPKTMMVNNVFVAHFLLLFAFRRIYSLKTHKNIKEKLFDSGLFIGLAAIFYSWSIVFLGLVIAAIFIRKIQNVRSILIPLIGFITPLFIVFTYYFMFDTSAVFIEKLNMTYGFSFHFLNNNHMLSLIAISSLLILSCIVVSLRLNAVTNDLRPSWVLLLIHLFLGSFILVFSASNTGSELLFTFFPAVIILANFLQLLDKMIFRDIILLLLVFLSVLSFI